MKIDTAANRSQQKYSCSERIKRILWGLVRPFFRFTPRVFFWWRAFLLRVFGAKLGSKVHVYNTAIIYFPWNLEVGDWSSIGEQALIYNLGKVQIGSNVTISQRAHICAGSHDYSSPLLSLLKIPIRIEDQAWICADAYVGPGVTVCEGAVVGARAVVVKDVKPWQVVGGNPAKFIKDRVLTTT